MAVRISTTLSGNLALTPVFVFCPAEFVEKKTLDN